MKKGLFVLLAIIVGFILTACSSSPSDVANVDADAVTNSNLLGTYEGELTLEFSFGTRTGNYSGSINEDGLPDGQGRFVSENPAGETWTYEGDWVDGHWEGNGISTWADGTIYSGKFVNDTEMGSGSISLPNGVYFEGEFTDSSNAIGFADVENGRFYAKMVDGTLAVGGVWRTGEFGDEISIFQGEWQELDHQARRLVINGESINFVHEQNIGSKFYRNISTFYFGFDSNHKLIVVNQGDKPRYDISIDENGILSISGGSKDELYEKISDNIEVPSETKEPEVGMSESEVYDSTWGAPKKRNTTSTASGKHEQWVYEDGYIYIEDGIVTAIQEHS